jgi:hypothetical protein
VHRCAAAPASSDPVAADPVLISALPTDPTRRITNADRGMPTLFRQCAADTRDYYVDLRQWLQPDERITGARAWLSPITAPAMEVQFVDYAEDGIVVWVAGGVDGCRYAVTADVTTSSGVTRRFTFMVDTLGTAEAVVLLSGVVHGGGVGTDSEHLISDVAALAFVPTTTSHTSSPMVITVTNAGADPQHINAIAITGDFAFTSTTDGDLDPGESFTISVVFTPTATGARTGMLTITARDVLTITLSGTGT